jgi:hypothetical protein
MATATGTLDPNEGPKARVQHVSGLASGLSPNSSVMAIPQAVNPRRGRFTVLTYSFCEKLCG